MRLKKQGMLECVFHLSFVLNFDQVEMNFLTDSGNLEIWNKRCLVTTFGKIVGTYLITRKT